MKAIIIALILILLINSGCSQSPRTTRVAVQKTSNPTPEKLVDVQNPDMTISIGQMQRNVLIIYNIKKEKATFNIIPCSGCILGAQQVEIPAQDSTQVIFDVPAEAGQKDIKVKDTLNNIYGTATVNVAVQ